VARNNVRYRSKTDIIAQILEAANGGTTKAKITYKTFLNYGQLREYLIALTESGLLNYELHTLIFHTTEKGLKFLKIYRQLVDMIKEEDRELYSYHYERKQV
jgi:predicted transcriptional regulator